MKFHDIRSIFYRWFKLATGPVMLSTLQDGKIVRGLTGVPSEGPVLLVGYHMLMGFELSPLIEAFLREKNVLVRGIAHPIIFSKKLETSLPVDEMFRMDTMRVFGALPVSAGNFYRLFSSKSFVLLYPGGVREALHRKVCYFISVTEFSHILLLIWLSTTRHVICFVSPQVF